MLDQSDRAPARLTAVHGKLQSVRDTVVRQQRILSAGRITMGLVVLATAICVADYYLELSLAARVVCLVAMISTLIFAIAYASRRHPPRYATKDAAADVEASNPEYGQRLRTTLDYTTPAVGKAAAWPGLVSKLSDDTARRTERDDFSEVVNRKPLYLTLAVVAGCMFVAIVSIIRDPELKIALGRTLLLPIEYTELQVEAADKPIPAGESLTVTAEISGRPVENARVFYREAAADPWRELQMRPAGEELSGDDAEPTTGLLTGKVTATFDDCRHDFEFYVAAGKLTDRVRTVKVLQPLEMESFLAEVQSPAYTGRQPEKHDRMDLRVIEGADLKFTMTMNRPAADAQLLPIATTAEDRRDPPRLTVEGNDLIGQFSDLRDTQQFTITAKAADGISFESNRFRIHVQPDAKPKIRFVHPPEELEVTPSTEVALAVDAQDDFGISKIGVACKVADGELETLWEEEYPDENPKQQNQRPLLFLEGRGLSYKDSVTYFAFVEDNRPGEKHRTTTELRFIDIRPYKREFQILEGGGT